MAGASSGYTWERKSYAFDQTSKSDPSTGVWDDASEDEPEDSEVSGVEAGECFVEFLLQLHFAGKLSAKSVCAACWFAHKAGAAAPVGQYAFRPNAPSGHYQRHLDLVTGVRVKEEVAWRYTVDIPQHSKYDLSRSSHECIVNVPHEVLNEEILGNAGILEKVAATTWPRAYYQNPVFQRHHGPVVPLALYLDGVPTTKKDGALGFWIYNLVTMRRHLIAVIRKSTMCKCGCKGWDSIHPLWCFLRWSLEAMSLGAFPSRRHDSRAWKAPDEQRSHLGGTPLAFRGMLLQIKGDWAEFSSSLGFTSWAASLAPCLFCRCTQASLADFGGWSPLSPVHALVGHADFEAACGACEQKRRLTKADWQLVKNSLAYVKASGGPRGRALLCDLPSLGLLKHDRLEPDLVLQGIAWFDEALFPPRQLHVLASILGDAGSPTGCLQEYGAAYRFVLPSHQGRSLGFLQEVASCTPKTGLDASARFHPWDAWLQYPKGIVPEGNGDQSDFAILRRATAHVRRTSWPPGCGACKYWDLAPRVSGPSAPKRVRGSCREHTDHV